jgi:hypothetical protein
MCLERMYVQRQGRLLEGFPCKCRRYIADAFEIPNGDAGTRQAQGEGRDLLQLRTHSLILDSYETCSPRARRAWALCARCSTIHFLLGLVLCRRPHLVSQTRPRYIQTRSCEILFAETRCIAGKARRGCVDICMEILLEADLVVGRTCVLDTQDIS